MPPLKTCSSTVSSRTGHTTEIRHARSAVRKRLDRRPLTHFAAPPVLMLARAWGWDLSYVLATSAGARCWLFRLDAGVFPGFRRQLGTSRIAPRRRTRTSRRTRVRLPPGCYRCRRGSRPSMSRSWPGPWSPPRNRALRRGFLISLFRESDGGLREPDGPEGSADGRIFLGGLVIDGGLQAWWIGPVLSRLSEATVPGGEGAHRSTTRPDHLPRVARAESARYAEPAVVAGAVTGGGLTVIANVPNPAGQALLARFYAARRAARPVPRRPAPDDHRGACLHALRRLVRESASSCHMKQQTARRAASR